MKTYQCSKVTDDFIIKEADLIDAEYLCKFVIQLDNESEYLLFEPGERKINIEATTNYIKKIKDNQKSIIYIAINRTNEIIGFVCGEANNLKRAMHVLKINIGVLRQARGTRITRELAKELISHAQRNGILRMEATVIKENTLSLNLCKKFGFQIEGLKKSSIKIGNNYHDEYLLAKLIG